MARMKSTNPAQRESVRTKDEEECLDPAVERGCCCCCCCCCCCGSSTLTLVGLMQQQHCLVKEKEVEYVDGALEKVDGSNLLGKPELYTPSLVRRGIDLCFEMKLRLCRW